MLWVVHVSAHAEAAEGNRYLLGLRQRQIHVMEDEVKQAKARGGLRGRKVFGIAHAGMALGIMVEGCRV